MLATRRDQLAKNAKGLPETPSPATTALLIIGHLAQALPAREAGAEVSLAIAGVAADSLSSMIPGLLGGGQAQGMLNGQRQRLMEQIGADLNNTLLYVYRDLTDTELEEFATFAESTEGQAYYQAALAAIRAGLAVGQNLRTVVQRRHREQARSHVGSSSSIPCGRQSLLAIAITPVTAEPGSSASSEKPNISCRNASASFAK